MGCGERSKGAERSALHGGTATSVRPEEEREAAGCCHTRSTLDHKIMLQCS